MIGGMYQTSQEITNGQGMSEITQLIRLLITEIRDTFNTKINILNEKIDMKTEENEYLRNENKKLQQIIIEQKEKIVSLSNNTTDITENSANKTIHYHDNEQENKQRGLKAHNLIITSSEDISDPQQYIENMFLDKFRRKPLITKIQPLDSTSMTNKQKHESDKDAQNPSQTRKFLVTLNSVWDARAIYKQRVQSLKNTGLYIGEDLDKEESHLFFLARQLKKQQIIHNTWTENGVTFIMENQRSSPRKMEKNDPILDQVKTVKSNRLISNTEQNHETQSIIQDKEQETRTSRSESSLNRLKYLNSTPEQNVNSQNKNFNTAGQTAHMKRITRKNTQDQQKNGHN